MKTILKLSFTFLASLLFLNVALAQGNTLRSSITLEGFNNNTNTYTIKYEDEGYGIHQANAASNFNHKLTIQFYDNAGTLAHEDELHDIYYFSKPSPPQEWGNCISCETPGFVLYQTQLPSSLPCQEYNVAIKIEVYYVNSGTGDITIYSDIINGYYYDYNSFPISSGIGGEHTFQNVETVNKINDCPAPTPPPVVDVTRFANRVDANVTSGTAPYTYQWEASNGGNIVGSTTGMSIDIDSGGTYCVTVTDASLQMDSDCIEITAIITGFGLSQATNTPNIDITPDNLKEKATIDNNEVISNYSVYPNPTTNKLFFDLDCDIPSTVTITDVSGKPIKMMEAVRKNEGMDVSQLEEGMYFIQINNKNGRQTKTFIKK